MELNERIAALETLLRVTREELKSKEVTHQREQEALKVSIAALHERLDTLRPAGSFKLFAAFGTGVLVTVKEVQEAIGGVLEKLIR